MKKRIKALAALVNDSKIIADIGCDHAHLIIELFNKNKIEFAYAIDNKDGPIRNATNNLINAGYMNKTKIIKADGLSFDFKQNIDTIILAGIGGINIVNILKKGQEKLKNIKYIIIDAHRHEDDVIAYLKEHNFNIKNDDYIIDNKKQYHLICFHNDEL